MTPFPTPGNGIIRYPSFSTKRPDYQDLRGVSSPDDTAFRTRSCMGRCRRGLGIPSGKFERSGFFRAEGAAPGNGDPDPNPFRFAWGGAGGDWVFPPANLSEADDTAPKARHQKEGILSDALFLVHRGNSCPNRRIIPNRRIPVNPPIWKGRRTQRMCSFRGSYANRGNGTKLSSSDVVHRGNSNPNRRL